MAISFGLILFGFVALIACAIFGRMAVPMILGLLLLLMPVVGHRVAHGQPHPRVQRVEAQQAPAAPQEKINGTTVHGQTEGDN